MKFMTDNLVTAATLSLRALQGPVPCCAVWAVLIARGGQVDIRHRRGDRTWSQEQKKTRGAIKKLELSFKKTILHKKNEKVIPNNLQHHCFTISTTDWGFTHTTAINFGINKNNFQAISCYLWWQIDESNQDRNFSICFWDSSHNVPSHTCFDIIIVPEISLQKLKVLMKASSFTVTQRFPEVSVFITSKDSLDSFGLKSPEPSWVPGRSLGRYCFSLWWLATGLLRRDTPVRASLPLL